MAHRSTALTPNSRTAARHAQGRPRRKAEPITFEVIHNEWDGNGAHRVTVRMTSAFSTDRTIRKARDLARRSVSRPELVQWTRLDSVYLPTEGGEHDFHMHYRFTVSRLDRSYR